MEQESGTLPDAKVDVQHNRNQSTGFGTYKMRQGRNSAISKENFLESNKYFKEMYHTQTKEWNGNR